MAKKKKKVFCSIKAHRGSRGIAPFNTIWRQVVSFTPWLLYPWEGAPVAIF
jgi:hypothetical protein